MSEGIDSVTSHIPTAVPIREPTLNNPQTQNYRSLSNMKLLFARSSKISASRHMWTDQSSFIKNAKCL